MMVRRHADWVSAKLGDQLVMMNVETDQSIGLSSVGAWIWALIEMPQRRDDVYAALLREFDVTPERCRSEVDAFLRELATQGAIILDPDSAA